MRDGHSSSERSPRVRAVSDCSAMVAPNAGRQSGLLRAACALKYKLLRLQSPDDVASFHGNATDAVRVVVTVSVRAGLTSAVDGHSP